jgi:hypothetical protein
MESVNGRRWRDGGHDPDESSGPQPRARPPLDARSHARPWIPARRSSLGACVVSINLRDDAHLRSHLASMARVRGGGDFGGEWWQWQVWIAEPERIVRGKSPRAKTFFMVW